MILSSKAGKFTKHIEVFLGNASRHWWSTIFLYLQIHLFDIDIPGQMTFKESNTLTAGETPTIVDTGLIGFPFIPLWNIS